MQDKSPTRKFNVVDKFDDSTNILFLLGFITSKLRQVPLLLFSTIVGLISILAYLFGYLIWYCAALFYPHQPRKHAFWYGFARFNDQYQMACALGIIACAVCLVGPAELLIPALWLFCMSNLIWSITEFHKLQNPPDAVINPNYSSEKQTIYMYYVISMTASTLVTTLCTTMIALYPPLTLIAMVLSLTLGNMLSIGGFYFLKSTFQDFTPEQSNHSVSPSSYTTLSANLGHININQNKLNKQDEKQLIETPTFNFRTTFVSEQTYTLIKEGNEDFENNIGIKF